jgi:ketosteroid isomerase-like protein
MDMRGYYPRGRLFRHPPHGFAHTASAMSRENVELVRRLFDAVASRDTEAVLSFYDPAIEWDGSRHRWVEVMAGDPHWHGHEGLRSFFRDYYETWADLRNEITELIDAGEHVVTVVNSTGRGRASGVEVEWPDNAAVWTIRDGKVVRVVWFGTRDEALEAAGLGE